MQALQQLSVVVLSWNTRRHTLACLAALARDAPEEMIVVDNASSDGSADAVAANFPAVRLHRNDTNLGWCAGHMQGAELAHGAYLCLLNSDTEPRPGALAQLAAFLDRSPDHGAVAPRLVGPDGCTQRACRRFPGFLAAAVSESRLSRVPPGSWIDGRLRLRDFDHETSRDVPQPPGACLVLRRDEFLALGGLDPAFFLYFGDVDLCLRLQARGRRIHYLAEAEVLHHGGASTHRHPQVADLWRRDCAAYAAKHHGALGRVFVRLALRLRALAAGA